jgi:hypothetical protein
MEDSCNSSSSSSSSSMDYEEGSKDDAELFDLIMESVQILKESIDVYGYDESVTLFLLLYFHVASMGWPLVLMEAKIAQYCCFSLSTRSRNTLVR